MKMQMDELNTYIKLDVVIGTILFYAIGIVVWSLFVETNAQIAAGGLVMYVATYFLATTDIRAYYSISKNEYMANSTVINN